MNKALDLLKRYEHWRINDGMHPHHPCFSCENHMDHASGCELGKLVNPPMRAVTIMVPQDFDPPFGLKAGTLFQSSGGNCYGDLYYLVHRDGHWVMESKENKHYRVGLSGTRKSFDQHYTPVALPLDKVTT